MRTLANTLSETQLAVEIIQEWGRFSGDRGNFETIWRQISERIMPSQAKLFQSGGMGGQSKGEQLTDNLVDSTGAQALIRFGAILDSLLTPRNQTWHRVMASDPYLNKKREVRLYFEDVNRVLFKYRYAPRANFASQNQQNYKSLGAFGTGCVFIDKLQGFGGQGLRYRNIHLGEIYFAENHQGIIDTALRYFPMTSRQAYQKWGDKLPGQIVAAAKSSPMQEFFFIHCVRPRADRDSKRIDYKGMPFASYYVSVTGQALLKEEGYQTFPYAPSRYEQVSGEVYGRSPAMDVLPSIKTLNEQKKAMLKQGHRALDPVLLSHDDGIADAFNWAAGALNAGGVTAEGRPLVHALPVGNLAAGKDQMDDERQLINDAFLVTLFQILTETPTMTATEVMERTREKGILLAPTIGRQQSEYLGPMVEREIDVLSQEGLLPPMPQILKEAKAEFRVEYDSPLSRAQRAEEASGLMRSIEMTLQVVNVTQNPEPLDFYDWDTIIPEINEIQGVPARWTKSLDKVMAVRQGRAQQQQTQEMIQAGPAAAAMVKAVGSVQRGK